MKRVFSRWPSSPAIPATGPEGTANGRQPGGRLSLVKRAFQGLALIGLPGAGGALLCAGVMGEGTSVLFIAAVAALLTGGLGVSCLIRDLQQARQRWQAVFERSGISLWLEDWTAVARAIAALKQEEVHDVQAYFTARPDLARALRRQVIITDVNAFTLQMMGASGKDVFIGSLDRILPDTDETFMQWLVAIANGEAFYRSETHITRPDGSVIDVLFTAALPKKLAGFKDITVTAIDVSNYKEAQARLVAAETEIARASRATTLGALTASIAHEVNSPLAAIVTNAEASLRWLRRPAPNLAEAEAAVDCVVTDATRARDVVARIRSFLINSPRRTGPIDLAETVRAAILLAERDLRAHGVSTHFDADEDLPLVLADPVQMQQVMVNLLMNAAHAMDGIAGPRDLTITLHRDGDDLRVDVRDVGTGIEPERITRIFTPFHSTRPDGMGMGLAICRNCVEAHGGRIWAISVPGQGSTFHFTLPAAKAQ